VGASVNVWLTNHLLRIRWDVRGVDQLDPKGQYLVCSNHQSWNDIFVLMWAFDRRAPFFKFFIKQQLIWVPFLGLAWWGLDYPFMKRYSPAKLAKHPELRGKDLETTRAACERYRNVPVTILNFLEGTRFTKAKHDRQGSPYRYLLKPKAGGMALSLSALGEKINSLLDVTIVYPDGARGFWQDGGLDDAEPGGDWQHVRGWDCDLVGVAAAGEQRADLIAHRPVGDVVAD